MELVLAISMMLLLLVMMFAKGRGTRDRMNSRAVAEELVARLRKLRQVALTKGVPVAFCIPTNSGTSYSDTSYVLEGELNPRAGDIWKIEQPAYRTVFFAGSWGPPTSAPTIPEFDLTQWWQSPRTAPNAAIYAFSPKGNVVSNQPYSGSSYNIVVAQGVQASGTSMTSASAPWTVSLAPSGEVELRNGTPTAVANSQLVETPAGATLTVTATSSNAAPTIRLLKASPDLNNPVRPGDKMLDVSCVLTLEARCQDVDGDPPFVRWVVRGARDSAGSSLSPSAHGGRFSNSDACRMEWSSETKEWVARTTWTPDTGDNGGYSYQLGCDIDDHRGGSVNGNFPVTGWLVTTREPWVLFKTLTASNRWELWKMTLLGQQPQKVFGLPNEDVTFGQWTSSGDEVIAATAAAVYRVSADGGQFRKVCDGPGRPIRACCLSPTGDKLYYTYSDNSRNGIGVVSIDAASGSETAALPYGPAFEDEVYGLSCGIVGGRTIVMQNFYRHYASLFSTTRRSGVMLCEADGTGVTGSDPAPGMLRNWGQNRSTTYGVSITEDGTEVLWGDAGGSVNIATVIGNASPLSGFTYGAPFKTFASGVADTHHPRYFSDHSGVVFAAGRGTAARIYCRKRMDQPPTSPNLYQIPLPAGLQCADEPTVSPPR